MKQATFRAMRDVVIEGITDLMKSRDDIFFLTGDFGAPALDKLRESFPDRFINTGIAEQNLINVATGLSLEGFTVYAYAIAPFITMRCYEQIRVNLGILSQVRELNVNLIGVGAGFSYVVSGPTHHCLEDIAIMNLIPNVELVSPADWVTARSFVDYSFEKKCPKYFRFDAKALPGIYDSNDAVNIHRGFQLLNDGRDLCIVSTGIMTHKALEIVDEYRNRGIEIGLIDFFKLKSFDREEFLKTIGSFKAVLTIEEGFVGGGGLDSIVGELVHSAGGNLRFASAGVSGRYLFDIGTREYLHGKAGIDKASLIQKMEHLLPQMV